MTILYFNNMNKYINNLNPYVFVVVWVILLAFLANLIPSMLTVASTFMNICAVIALAVFVYILTVGYKYWSNRLSKSNTNENSKNL